MPRFFYDTEFYEDGRTVDLLSLGMVNDTDRTERYWINYDFDFAKVPAGHWIEANVYPHLPVRRGGHGRWTWDLVHPDAVYLRSRPAIAGELRAYITSYGVKRDFHELWAWYGAYDHVALCQCFGRMLDLPESIPMFTCDLKQLVAGYPLPEQKTGEHHALADARWVRDAWRYFEVATRPLQLDVKSTPLPDVLALIDAVRSLPTSTLDDILAKTRGTEFAAQLIKVHG